MMNRPTSRRLALAYVVALHLAFAFVLYRTGYVGRVLHRVGLAVHAEPELGEYYATQCEFHRWVDAATPPGAVLFVGDSITEKLPVLAVDPHGVNFGISGDTTAGVLRRLPLYHLAQVRAIVLAVGVNDLMFRPDSETVANFRRILDALPPGVLLVVSAILPVDEATPSPARPLAGYNARIAKINTVLREECVKRPGARFLRSRLCDGLRPEYNVGDGLHLSVEGYRVWVEDLRGVIDRLPPRTAPQSGP